MADWIFDGIGTQLIVYILGIISGVIGCNIHQKNKNKQIQKAGNGVVQIQTNELLSKNKKGELSDGEGDSSISVHYVGGDNIISTQPDEFDIRNFSRYGNTEIEHIVIARGNNATLRVWCLELILSQKSDYLIRKCIEKMDNDKEKIKLLEDLVKREQADSDYFFQIGNSIKNSIYLEKLIRICLSIDKKDYAEIIFGKLKNNQYIYNSFVYIYRYDQKLFEKLYDEGGCFTNQRYKEKMDAWLSHQ